MTSKLAEAISLAALAHDGQVDKNGEPYILHCLRVMLAQKTEEARIAGVLHDLLQTTSWTADGLRALGFSEDVVLAIEALNREDGEKYDDYLDRLIDSSDIALGVKAADALDNLRPILAAANPYGHRARYTRALRLLWSRPTPGRG
jgi:guanosine-3',5'-bis(diphosphate) 3'-pyrophosphohydrolase